MTKPKRSREQWLALFEEQKNSRQTINDFCQERSIPPSYFSTRKHQLLKQKVKNNSHFAQAKLAPAPKPTLQTPTIRLRARNCELALPVSVEPRWLAQLIRELDA